MTKLKSDLPNLADGRCPWAGHSELLGDFHDHEWGEPVAEASILFEYLVLHTFQLGFDFPVVLKRREGFRELLANFEPERIARFTEDDIAEMLLNPRILRNRRKLEATVQNAQAWLRLRAEVGGEAGLLPFFYQYVGGRPVDNRRSATNPVPLTTPASEAMSKDLKRRGFVMTGPMTCYNILQTAGLVNDHLLSCPRHAECAALAAQL
ncbi:DNA-3-methyladenine glycosylase I [Hymenobacter cellulosilyticus]|uniref:DNA-3-methyladenine glycosylase I n=1 Tax=Hymenobacter cellulosilyticus TaxID=2932248 RepID=A0A8T9QBD5_9BACT|nr:DNA-3-methyladenine glycosylase I [Hymenobacter cellulosilyticus]UOQ74495.1 DNA-3-methyladenine glycosylase I [Hymenobacter cellulosilyticus]